MPTKLEVIGQSSPGWKGLNLQSSGGFLTPEWATVATNLVFDETGRLASRKGWTKQSVTAQTEEIEQIYEYISVAGAGQRVFSTATTIKTETAGTITDRTPTSANDDGNYKFQNWNDGANQLVLGLNNNSTNSKYVQWDGAAAKFTAVTITGTAPDGDDFMVAWGRAWGLDSNGTILKWSVPLDHTDWSGVGSGSLNLYNVFGEGMDRAIAIAAFNSALVIFGTNNILIYSNTVNSEFGETSASKFVDPTAGTFGLADHIIGSGCIARDSVQNIGTDLLFLDNSGVKSLARQVQEKGIPLNEETKNIRDHLAIDIHEQTDKTKIRSTFNQEYGIYLLSLPDLSTPEVYCLDMRGKLEDGSRRITIWNSLNPTAMFSSRLADKELYFGTLDTNYFLSRYNGTTDNGTSINLEYLTGWLSLTPEERLMIPKKIGGIFQTTGTHQIGFKWAFDFRENFRTATKVIIGSSGSQYGIAQYGIDKYTSGESTKKGAVNMSGFGEHIKYGFSTTTDKVFATSKLEIHTKLGRTNL